MSELFALLITASVCASAPADTSVTVFDAVQYPGGWGSSLPATVTLPDANAMHAFNSMTIAMDLGCPANASCPPWDFVASLYSCENANTTTCTTEIARWITAYGAPGSWTTDISPMLAALQKGGQHTFLFTTPQAYTLSVKLNLSASKSGIAPTRMIPLFGGGNLDLNYNPAHKPMTVTFTQKPLKTELFALVTGHGWGDNAENCAEFCNIAHHFGVNGNDTSVDFPDAGSATGCQDLVSQGVVPNQAGTWQYGRDGWCPGWDVHPFTADVTADVQQGNNTFTYEALYNGQPYNPTAVSSPPQNAIGPSINLSSYLVVWDTPAVSAPKPPPTQPQPTGGSSAAAAPGKTTTSGCSQGGAALFVWLLPAGLLMKPKRKLRTQRK